MQLTVFLICSYSSYDVINHQMPNRGKKNITARQPECSENLHFHFKRSISSQLRVHWPQASVRCGILAVGGQHGAACAELGPHDTSGQQTTCVRQRSPVPWEPTAPEGGVLSAFLYQWLLNFSTGGCCIFFPWHWVADGSDNWRHFQSRFKVKLIYTGGKNKPINAVKHLAVLDCDCSGISLVVLHLEKFRSWVLFCLLLSKFFSCNIPINWIIWESLVGFE